MLPAAGVKGSGDRSRMDFRGEASLLRLNLRLEPLDRDFCLSILSKMDKILDLTYGTHHSQPREAKFR